MADLVGSQGSLVADDAPKIEFPCSYPIKVLGRNEHDFEALVIATMSPHTGTIAPADVSTRPSGKGTFVSVAVVITATGEAQLQAIFDDLKATGRVKMVI
ncbi:MAG: putative lipoic acid-binding regulatory protein [Paraglaciecola psychrophila]|jgi:putative lipoic acid-binding regulatory protein